MRLGNLDIEEVWAADFEFSAPPGERPTPICLVARNLVTGVTVRYFGDDLRALKRAPFRTDGGAVFVAYYAVAEIACFLELGWPLPEKVLDLFVEFRRVTNGRPPACGYGLLGALAHFNIPAIDAAGKVEMRDLAIRGGPFTDDEAAALLAYCETDVLALAGLVPALAGALGDLDRALLRGDYIKAVARMERVGIPVDDKLVRTLDGAWERIQDQLIQVVDSRFGFYEGRSFRTALFAAWLGDRGMQWLRLPSGELDLSDDAFKQMVRAYPALQPVRELRRTLSGLRLHELAVGRDGRNRAMLSPFRARSGRNQPSNSKFIFGNASWLRGLIKPEPGSGLAYIDWSQQEFGIAAALSGDEAMMRAYASGDPYLEFAKQAGAAPPSATKRSHAAVREQFKACALGVQYSMGPDALALRMGSTPAHARELLFLHHRTYPHFWKFVDGAVTYAMVHGRLWTTFGWDLHVGSDVNPRSLGNFPMQSNGAEMLRLACILASRAGVRICAPVHDAVLIEAPLEELDARIADMQAAMEEASALVLDGFRLRSDVKVVRAPDRFMEERGRPMWDTVMGLLGRPDQ